METQSVQVWPETNPGDEKEPLSCTLHETRP
jgi:hypothetical protein